MIRTPPHDSISLRAFLRWLREEKAVEIVIFEGKSCRRAGLLRQLEEEHQRGERHELDTVRIDWQPVFSLPEEGRWPPAGREVTGDEFD